MRLSVGIKLLFVFGILLAGVLVYPGPERVTKAIKARVLPYFVTSGAIVQVTNIIGEGITNDSLSKYQWALRMMLDGANYWEIQGNAPRDVVVAVIDKGVHLQHEDLKNRLHPKGFNFIDRSADLRIADDYKAPNASITHGQCAASIIASEPNNQLGLAGVFHRAYILPLQSDGHLADAINYAVKNGANIILISGGAGDGGDICILCTTIKSLCLSQICTRKKICRRCGEYLPRLIPLIKRMCRSLLVLVTQKVSE